MARGRYIAAGSTVGTGPFIELPMQVDQYGRALVIHDTALAFERNRGLANAYGAFVPECNYTAYNPHTAAAIGTLTAGTAGATEALITASPCIVIGIEWASDTAAGSVLLYDKAATGGTAIPYPVLYAAGQQFHGPLGKKFNNGLTIVGTAAGVCCNVLWRLQ